MRILWSNLGRKMGSKKPSKKLLKGLRCMQITAQLFRPPMFDPRKLTTTFLPGASGAEPQAPVPRRYTLTHNDITGQLYLSIGCNYNTVQVSGWYTKLIR